MNNEREPIYLHPNLKKVMADLLLAQALKVETVEEAKREDA